jgi:hypothetical protein
MNADLLVFPPTGGAEFDQPERCFSENGVFVELVEFLPGPDFTLAAAAAEADVVGEFAEVDAGVFG